MENEPNRRRKSSRSYGAIAVITGAAFAIVAVTHAPGIAYVIVAIVAGLCYTLLGMFSRRG
jgi:Flp pilus assembly protein TadB